MPLKIIFLGAVTMGAAAVTGYFFSANLPLWWLVSGILLLILMVLQMIFISDRRWALGFIATEGTLLSLSVNSTVLYNYPIMILLISIIFIILLFWAHQAGRWRLKNNLQISFAELRRHALPLMSATMAGFLIASYALNLLHSNKPLIIPRQVIQVAVQPLMPILEKTEKIELFEAVAIKTKPLQPIKNYQERLIDVVHKSINALLVDITPQQRRSFVLTAAVFIFTIAAAGLFFLNFLVAFLAWLAFKLMLLAGFAKIESESVYKQKIVI